MENRCLATSGDYETAFSEDFSQHHIVNPRTGRLPEELARVSVLAPDAMTAVALSTELFVLGAERGMELLNAFEHTDALLIRNRRTPPRHRQLPLHCLSYKTIPVLLFLAAAVFTRADTIELANGNKVDGKVLENNAAAKTLTVEFNLGGKVTKRTVPYASVKAITVNGTRTVLVSSSTRRPVP